MTLMFAGIWAPDVLRRVMVARVWVRAGWPIVQSQQVVSVKVGTVLVQADSTVAGRAHIYLPNQLERSHK